MSEKMYDLRDGYVPAHLRGSQAVEPQLGNGQFAPVAMAPPGGPDWATATRNERQGPKGAPAKYPFATMPVNGTFRVPIGPGQPKWRSFRTYCSNKGSELGKRFRCHRYEDGTYEVWRER